MDKNNKSLLGFFVRWKIDKKKTMSLCTKNVQEQKRVNVNCVWIWTIKQSDALIAYKQLIIALMNNAVLHILYKYMSFLNISIAYAIVQQSSYGELIFNNKQCFELILLGFTLLNHYVLRLCHWKVRIKQGWFSSKTGWFIIWYTTSSETRSERH